MGKQILTVDDSSSIRQMVTFTLKSAGYDVTDSHSGDDALVKIKNKKYDLILTDQNMPGMDGLTLLKNIKQNQTNKTTPVLILTTEISDTLKSQAKNLGATGWLVKPFDPKKLLDVVKKLT